MKLRHLRLHKYQSQIVSHLSSRKEIRKAKPVGAGTEFRAEDNGRRLDLWIYGVIGENFWESGVDALDVNRTINEFNGAEIVTHINSGGGDVFDGIAIYNALRASQAAVTTVNEGAAMSAASVILQAGDERVAQPGSNTMVHRAWTFHVGNARDFREMADLLDAIDVDLSKLYENEQLDADTALELMDAETFMQAQDAFEKGFVDRVGLLEEESEEAVAARGRAEIAASAPWRRLCAELRLAARKF